MEEETGVPGDFGMVCHMKKQRRRRQKLLVMDLFLDFAKNTTLHGLRYITEVGLTAAEKIFWIITFVISLVLCFVLIERVWHKWWFSPVIVSFNERMIPVGEVPFPSVTICPQWKLKQSKFNYSTTFKQYIGRRSKVVIGPQRKIQGEIETLGSATMVCSNNVHPLNQTITNESIVKNIVEIAPNINDIFPMYCTWRGKKDICLSMFRKVLTSEGVCFNFNALANTDMFKKGSIQTRYKYLYSFVKIKDWDYDSGYSSLSNDTFPRRGQAYTRVKVLSLSFVNYDDVIITTAERYPVLDILCPHNENGAKPDLDFILKENPADSDELCNSMFNGFKIYLHHPADMPQSSLYYYAAIPGQLTSLALKFTALNTSDTLKKYSSGLRQCYFPEDRKLQYFNIYTPSNCRLECLSIYTYERCGCVWFHMPHSNSSEICTASRKRCVANAQDELVSQSRTLNESMEKRCNCLPSCNSIQYDAEILKTNFDYKKNQRALKKALLDYKNPVDDTRNFSRVELYFKEPRFVSMRRSELFGLTDFLANCGGLLGLFLGFSFLSFIEIFYFCTLRLWCILKSDIKIEKKQLKESMHK